MIDTITIRFYEELNNFLPKEKRIRPLREPKFILDEHLHKVAQYSSDNKSLYML